VGRVSAATVEALLARLYADPALRHEFLANARAVATRAGLEPKEIEAFVNIDRTGLEMAAESYERKRDGRRGA